MPFVERDSSGKIVAARAAPTAASNEWVDAGHPDLAALTGSTTDASRPDSVRAALEHSDQGLIRVLEDLIDTLLAKDVIRFTDLPIPAQNRLLQRRNLRASLTGLTLLDDDNGLL